jgi:hypothetical protein
MPVFLLSMMVITQGAMWFLARSTALAAARQGVDAARAEHSSRAAGVAEAVRFAQQSGSGFLLTPSAQSVGSSGQTVVITVTGRVPSLVPGLPIHVSQQAQGAVERFTTP